MKHSGCFIGGKISSTAITVLLGIVLCANPILIENQAQITGALGAKEQVIITDEENDGGNTEYFTSDFKNIKELKDNERKIAEEISQEGIVLLKNENNALPINKNSTVGFYSINCVDPIISGGGSSQANPADTISFKDAFEENGFKVNQDLWNWYTTNKGTYDRTATSGSYAGRTYDIEDAPWDKLPASKSEQTDLAVFVLGRTGGESTDIFMVRGNNGEGVGAPMDEKYPLNNSDIKNGNYLELNDNEISVLKGLKALKDQGKIKKILILMNFANQVELDWIDSNEYGVDAALWAGTLGSVGTRAIAKIISGEVNPSGGLVDTFWTRHHYNPVYANWTDSWFGYQYEEKPQDVTSPYSDDKVYNHTGSNVPTLPFVVYEEGIYNGYKYTETRYEDVVMKTDKVGTFNYYDAVKYPFGYGLSYTTFKQELVDVTFDNANKEYTVKVDVTNTGSVAGKSACEVYAQKPYTQYDKKYGVEKSAVDLVSYGKTKLLQPNEKETLFIKVKGEHLASYDSYKAKTYILENGDYYFAIAQDAHEAVNNILAKKGYGKTAGMTEEGNASLVEKFTIDYANFDENGVDATIYSKAVTGNEITNKFDNADPNIYFAEETRNEVNYLTRNDWEGTVEFGLTEDHKQINDTHAVLYWNDQLLLDLFDQNPEDLPQIDDVAYPTMNSTENSYTLADMRELEYDDPLWEDLLDQLSFEDMIILLTDGERKTQAISSIGKPYTIDHNGAIGVNQSFGANAGNNRGLAIDNNDPDKGLSPIAYPCNGIVAATFNDELVYKYGQQWGEDALWAGYSGLYGPGANGHRSAYAGRNFEYYSEDGILGGKICAKLCEGIVEHGILVYLKHAILNEQEINRLQVSTYANEQTIREVYLRPFELAIVDGGAQNVMTAYNKIGAKYSGIQGFCNSVLRDEFGMKGFAVTDYLTGGHENRMPGNIINGNDLPDRNWLYARHILDKYDGSQGNYGNFVWQMREACHHILYGVASSCAMNGLSSNTKIIKFTPTWVHVLDATTKSLWILFGTSLSLCALAYVYDVFKDKKILCGEDDSPASN